MARKRPVVVIGISSTHLKIVALDTANDKLSLSVIKDLSSLRQREEKDKFIVSALREALRKDVLRGAGVFFCLSDELIQIKRIDLPHMPANEMADAIKWRLKDLISFDSEKGILDFDIVGEKTDEDGAKKLDVIVATTPRILIEKNIALIKESGVITINGVNIDAFGLSNIIKLAPEGKGDRTCAVLNMEHASSALNIYKGGKLVFVRNIPVGLNHITESIKDRVLSDKGVIELTSSDIARLKNVGIPDNEDVLLDGKLKGKHILANMRPIIENLCNEIGHSLDYYNVQLEGGEVSKLYLAGDGSLCRNLDRFIKDTLGIETEYLKAKGMDVEDIMPQIISLIGIAKGGMKGKVNLLPMGYRMEKIEKIEKMSIRMTGFTVLAVLLVLYLFVSARVNDYKRQLVSARSHRETLKEIKNIYDTTLEKEKFIKTVKGMEVPTVLILKELSNIIPDNIILNNLTIDQRNRNLRLDGIIYLSSVIGEVVLTNFMERMESSPYFKSVNLESSRRDVAGDKQITLFVISCTIEG